MSVKLITSIVIRRRNNRFKNIYVLVFTYFMLISISFLISNIYHDFFYLLHQWCSRWCFIYKLYSMINVLIFSIDMKVFKLQRKHITSIQEVHRTVMDFIIDDVVDAKIKFLMISSLKLLKIIWMTNESFNHISFTS